MAFNILYVTHPDEITADEIASTVVGERLAACGNVFPITSTFWWEGIIENEAEWVSILKTTMEKREELMRRIESLHPYEVPCIMIIEVSANKAYEKWIADSVA